MAVSYRLLALDIDGTLLDRVGHLRPRTREAVIKAAEAGIRPVLCTGRRYRRARPIAEELGVAAPLVCNSGALVKDPDDDRTLWRADLDPQVVADLLTLYRDRNEYVISFIDRPGAKHDFFAAVDPSHCPLVNDYLAQNRPFGLIDPTWIDRLGRDASHFHVCAIGSREQMLKLRDLVVARFPGQFTTFVQRSPRYEGTFCEVLRNDADKWNALVHLAELWGVDSSEIIAVGDDMNDVAMLKGAGLGVAMGHAPAEVIAAADHVTLDEQSDGLASFIENHLLA